MRRSLKGTVRVKISAMEADWFKDGGRKTIGLDSSPIVFLTSSSH